MGASDKPMSKATLIASEPSTVAMLNEEQEQEDEELYPATLSVLDGSAELAVTGDGKTATVDAALNTHEHTLVLHLTATPSTTAPLWPQVAGKLKDIGDLDYTGVPSPLSLPAVITLKKLASELDPAWPDVAESLKSLGNITVLSAITCVGPDGG